MGGNQSMNMDTFTKVLNQNLMNQLKETKIDSTNSSFLSQSITVTFRNSNIYGCDINMSVKTQNNQTTIGIIQLQSDSDIKNFMTQAFNQTLQQNQKAVNDFLSTTFQNQDTSVRTSNDLENIFQQNISNANLTSLKTLSSNLQAGNFTLEGLTIVCNQGQGVNISEDAIANQYVNNASSEIISILSQNKEVADLIQKLKAAQSSENKGVSSLLMSLGLFILIPLAIIALFFFLNSKGKSLKEAKQNLTALNPQGLVKEKFYFF